MPEKYMMRLQKLREDVGFTQEEIAAILGICKRTYVQYELGNAALPVRYLVSLCKLYRKSSDVVLGLKRQDGTSMHTNFPEPARCRTRNKHGENDMAAGPKGCMIFFKKLRENYGLTLMYVAQYLGIPQRIYYQYECGCVLLPDRFLILLCKLYHLDPAEVRAAYNGPDFRKTNRQMMECITTTDFFKKLRIDAGFTQSEIAEYLGMLRHEYSRYECGNFLLPQQHIRALCGLYGITEELTQEITGQSKYSSAGGLDTPAAPEPKEYMVRLKKLRIDHGYIRSDIAEYLNVPVSTYSNYEKNGNSLPVSSLIALCILYDVSSDSILDIPEYNRS